MKNSPVLTTVYVKDVISRKIRLLMDMSALIENMRVTDRFTNADSDRLESVKGHERKLDAIRKETIDNIMLLIVEFSKRTTLH